MEDSYTINLRMGSLIKFFKINVYIMVRFAIRNQTVRVVSDGRMVNNMQVNGQMLRNMDLDNGQVQKVIIILVNG